MALKILLVDPDISFAVGIKRALEQVGGYRVVAFASGHSAIELVRAESQDVAILDFEPGDIDLAALIDSLRAVQPALFILVSPRTEAQAAHVRTLNVQGSITKPYLARQLIPVLRESQTARTRQLKSGKPATGPLPPLPPNLPLNTPSVSPDFDAALAGLAIHEPPIQPDDTFRRRIAALQPKTPETPAGLRKFLDTTPIPPAAESATLGELVAEPPESLPLMPPILPPASLPPQPTSSPGALDVPTPEQAETSPGEPSFVAALTADSSRVMAPLPASVSLEAIEPATSEASVEPTAPAEPDPAAEVAARLTHLALQSAVKATILTRAGKRLAAAGSLSEDAIAAVVETVAQLWQTAEDDEGENVHRLRFIQVPGTGDCLLYATRSVGDLCLAILFPADMPLRLIRQQARRLVESLERDQAEQPPIPDEPAAASTLVSRPTSLRPPEAMGLSRTQTGQSDEPGAKPGEGESSRPAAVLYSPYTLIWQPKPGALSPENAAQLPTWIEAIAAGHSWQVRETIVSSGCLSVRIDLPAEQTPGTAIDALQRETAQRAGSDLWADGYYVIASERSVMPQELEQFIGYKAEAI